MTIQQFEYVLALNKHRHYVRAAESVNVTQPTLTMQVKKLEQELGFEIFDRKTKPLKPTKSGIKVIDRAIEIIGTINQLKIELHENNNLVKGNLKLAVIPTLAPYLLPLFIQKLTLNHPNLNVSIHELQSDVLLEKLNNNEVDIGLLVTPTENLNVIEQCVFYEPFLYYGSPNHHLLKKKKIKASDVEQEAFWVLSQGHCFRDQVLNICGNPKYPNHIHYESGSIETVKRLVDNGNSFTLIPELSVLTENERKLTRPFEAPVPVREISLVYSKAYNKKGIVKALHDSIIENLPKHLKKVERKKRIKWR